MWSLTPPELRRAFACFPSGVTAVCALVGDAPAGLVANSFTSVSLEPPLVSICIANSSKTWPTLRSTARLGVSVLSEAHSTIVRDLSALDPSNRFRNVDWSATSAGAVLVNGSSLAIECILDDEIAAGDHVIALLAITAIEADPAREPLVFHGSTLRLLADLADVEAS